MLCKIISIYNVHTAREEHNDTHQLMFVPDFAFDVGQPLKLIQASGSVEVDKDEIIEHIMKSDKLITVTTDTRVYIFEEKV